MRILSQHRIALVAFGLLFLAAAAAHWFLVRPLNLSLAGNAEEIAKKETRLQRTGLPLDASLLEEEIQFLDAQLNGTRDQPGVLATTKLVLETSTRMLMDRVAAQYGTAEQFRRNADRVFFQSDFSRISLKLAERNTFLEPGVLGISDESPSPYIYQLLLRIWTAERLADLAAEAGLAVATVDGGKAADLRLLEVRGYKLNEADKLPYLIELPVQATLLGDMPQVKSFLHSLTAGGNFLPASQVELFADDPARQVYRDGTNVKVTGLRLKVQCSAFFLLAPAASPAPGEGAAAIPAGG